MKTKARFLTLLLTLLLAVSVSLMVSAASAPEPGSEAPGISQAENTVIVSTDTENPDANIPSVQGETPDEPEAADGEVTAPRKSSNTPFFIGAGIAVVMFAGVSVYCKTNGNKTL